MNPVQSVKNQYRGINAHLHSYWQAKHKWNRFHNVHIAELTIMLNAQLLPLGYTAENEESLQIRRIDDSFRSPRADIVIQDTNPQRALTSPSRTRSGMHLEALREWIDDEEDLEHPYYAVAIYERDEAESGVPIAWIELLSPSNKGTGRDAREYRSKRKELIHSGLVFVELDYLHETPATFRRLTDYTRDESDSHPYRIIVLEPRPDYEEGIVDYAEFDVDAVIPKMTIPLSGNDQLEFDFGASYQKTFQDALYGYKMDYSQLPLNFERYSEADRARIANRMLTVLKAAQAGVNLEANAPLPIENLPLETALEQIKLMVG